jgi:tetratricopeptide (TPR) repeat protein
MRRRKPRIDYVASYLARIRETSSLPNDQVYRELDRIVREAASEPAAAADVVSGDAASLIQRIHNARFAPAPPSAGERLAITREAERVIAALFERRSTQAGAFLVLALLTVQQPAGSPAVQAYDAGDYGRAVVMFEQDTARAPHDASAWYNLGNAHYRAGETGKAIWAWARALQAEPRSADVVHNLRMAGGVEAIRVRPPLAATAEEWWLAAALLWWIAAAMVMVALVRRRRISPWVAAPLLSALILAIVGWRAATLPQYAVTLTEPTALHSEPTVRSATVRRLRVGAVVTVEQERGEWLYVRTIDDREAWVARDDVGLLARD